MGTTGAEEYGLRELAARARRLARPRAEDEGADRGYEAKDEEEAGRREVEEAEGRLRVPWKRARRRRKSPLMEPQPNSGK